MNILAFDTSGKRCTVALQFNGTLFENHSCEEKKHSVNLLPLIDKTLQEAQASMDDLDYIATVVGPGSFTGVRISAAHAKGFCHGLNTPCIMLNTLNVLANIKHECDVICPILDARANQVYTQIVGKNGVVLSPCAIKIEELAEHLKSYSSVMFCGDGVPPYKEKLKELIPSAVFSELTYASAELLIEESIKNASNAVSYDVVNALYLRAPQAERERLARSLNG